MCRVAERPHDFDIEFINNWQDLMQKLYALYYYLSTYPQLGDFPSSLDGHVLTVEGFEITIFEDE